MCTVWSSINPDDRARSTPQAEKPPPSPDTRQRCVSSHANGNSGFLPLEVPTEKPLEIPGRLDSVRFPVIPKDLGNTVTWETEWSDVTAFADIYHSNVFFVWEYQRDENPSSPDAGGVCNYVSIMLEDACGDHPDWTLAHEFGHMFAIEPSDYEDPSRKDELMYAFSSATGYKLLHSQICLIPQP